MSTRVSLLIQLCLFAILTAWTLWRLGPMPDIVPVHWGISGKLDRYGSKWEAAWIMPVMLLFMAGMTVVLPKISPRKFDISRFSSTYNYVMVLVSLMMGVLHVIIIQASAGAKFDITQVMMAVMFIFFALMGNVMGKVKQNFFMGIKTPWTLADEQVWDDTHRYAAYLWFVGGIVGALLSVLGVPLVALIAILLVISFLPVIRSYQLYRKLGL